MGSESLYISICFASFFLVIPSVLLIFMDAAWIRSTQHIGLTIVTASIVGVVAFPFLHLLEDASTTRDMVSDIKSSVNRFKWAPVQVDQRSDTKSLVAFVAEHDSPVVFLGFSDVELVRGLLDNIPNRETGELYINPRVLKVLMLLLNEQHKMMPERIYVTDCPRDSCTVFGYNQNGERSCIILRGVPLQNKWWSANLSPKSDYTEHLFATYSDIYINSSTVLDSYLKAIFIRNLYHESISLMR